MMFILTILIGIYLVSDAVFLAAKTNSEHRFCMAAKYTGAVMSGLYLVFTSRDELSLLLGVTIALFMWPETYYRILDYLLSHRPDLYIKLIELFKHHPRRKSDY